MPEANHQLRAARERTPSPRVPGEPMGRGELAEAVCAWLWDTTGQRYDLDARALGRYERGDVHWPSAAYRSALRHVLDVDTDAALGFASTTSRTTSSTSPPLPTAGTEPWALADALTRSTIDGSALDHMERAVHGYAQRYPSTSPNLLWPSVSAQITRLNDALSHPQP
ncbi:MAG: hypothetical protein M3443_04120, partial [Actinomycetota bacterium]|nr:hypothetical protein [Actinomycetota bacterium]